MPGLLDNFLSDPNLALGAGLLSPTPGKNFGTALSQGLQARQQAVSSQENSKLRNLQSQIREKEISDANKFASLLSNNQELLQSGDQRAALNLLGGASNMRQALGAASILGSLQPNTATMPTTEFERLDALVEAGKATPGQIDRWKKLKDAAAGINVAVDLQGYADKERMKDLVEAENTAIDEVGKVRALEGSVNTLLRGLANGAPIGTVASAIMTTDVVRSQFNQAINSKAKLEDQISDLSGNNKKEFRNLVELAMQGNEVAAQKLSLVYLLAGSRETGKLSDTDLKLAFDSIESGSVEGMITRLISTRDSAIDQLNSKLETNMKRRGESPAFSPFEKEKVFTVESITNAPNSVIKSLAGMNSLSLNKLLDEKEKKALVARMLGLQ